MKQIRNGHAMRIFQGGVLVAFFAILSCTAVGAVTAISQGYMIDEQPTAGTIVSLKKNSNDSVEPATIQTVDRLLGVVINPGSSLLVISNETKQAQISTTGVASVFVSDINGEISAGDLITASPIKGVGMKATSNTKVVGVAQGTPNYDTQSHEYTNAEGQKDSFRLGQVPIVVSISFFTKSPDKTIIPTALQNVANAVAGKKVSTLPILISSAIFVIMLIAVVSIIYSMIRSSIISIGRNPMAQSAVYRDVIQLSGLVIVILSVSLIAIYIILTKL